MPAELAQRYKSPAQQARVVSETWGQENLYCAACASPKLAATPVGTQVVDYTCPQCDSAYQLKSQSRPFSRRITDAAYDAMVRAIRQGRTPNLFALHYDLHRWAVLNLILVPRFAFSLSCIEKRNPLRTAAERHGWVGCNILLGGIPPDARIPVVVNGVPNRVASVREQYARLRPLGARFRSDGPVEIPWGPYRGGRACYLRDPDGISIELIELPPGGPRF